MNISQSDFIDYLSRKGLAKSKKVQAIYLRPDYQPAFDFYKSIRERIVETLKYSKGRNDFFEFLDEVHDIKKIFRFQKLIGGLLKFLGRKKISWFDPPINKWTYKELQIKMNPELGLIIGEERYIVKLYFKETPLQLNDAKILLWMMEEALCTDTYKGCKPALLDVERGRLRCFNKAEAVIKPLIEGEAECFIKLWQSFDKKTA